jgi:hypothetical protein
LPNWFEGVLVHTKKAGTKIAPVRYRGMLASVWRACRESYVGQQKAGSPIRTPAWMVAYSHCLAMTPSRPERWSLSNSPPAAPVISRIFASSQAS